MSDKEELQEEEQQGQADPPEGKDNLQIFQEYFDAALEAATDSNDAESFDALMQAVSIAATDIVKRSAKKAITKVFNEEPETINALQQYVVGIDDYLALLEQLDEEGQYTAGAYSRLWFLFDHVTKFLPYIAEEVEAYKKETGKETVTFEEFARPVIDPETGNDTSRLARAESRLQEQLDAEEAAKRAQEEQEASKEDLNPTLPPQQYKGVKVTKYVTANNPLANSMTGRTQKATGEILPIINAGAFDMPVGRGGATVYTQVTADSGIKLEGRPYTWYDRRVSNAIISSWEAGNTVIYPEQICRICLNKTDSEKPSAQQVAAVTKSIEKQRQIHAYVDLSEEAKRRKYEVDGNPVTEFVIDDNLLYLTGMTITVGGTRKRGYMILKEPVLLTYSKMTRQLITIPSKLLDIKKVDRKTGKTTSVSMSMTERRIKISEYLLWRIGVMKHDRKNKKPIQNNHISYETLYRETDTPLDKKQQRQKTRDDALLMCAFWKAEGHIKDYSEYPGTGHKQGIAIDLQ